MEEVIVDLVIDYLPRLKYPIRCGIHSDTAFALGMIYDYDRVTGGCNVELKSLIEERGRRYYAKDRNYPFVYEPSGEDFFSSGLNEADFIRRILPPTRYADWLTQFAPLLTDTPESFPLQPLLNVDLTDGRLAHQAGLNLSRAWTMRGIASGLPDDDPRVAVLQRLADDHLAPLQQHVFSGQYEGEHWLGTFAVYLLTSG